MMSSTKKFRIVKKKDFKNTIIDNFSFLIIKANTLDEKGASFKSREYNDTIKALKEYLGKISTIKEVEKILVDYGKKNPKKTLQKIDEIIKTGVLFEVEEAKKNQLIIAVQNLTKVYSIGYKKAKQLYSEYNIITFDDLKIIFNQNNSILHGKQKLGLKYYDDLNIRIPRKEIEKYEQKLLECARDVDPSIKLSINGSYRRGHIDSGDIDVLITADKDVSNLRTKFIDYLKKKKIIVDVLANGTKKFMGITTLTEFNIFRHIDIIETTKECYAFGVLYFTGSGGFNTRMRLHALNQGYSLNEYCLSDKLTKLPISKDVIYSKIGKYEIKEEIDIFTFLKMKYIFPNNRNNI